MYVCMYACMYVCIQYIYNCIYIGMPWNTHWHTGVAASLRNLPLLQALTALDTPKGSPPKSPYYSEATQYYSEATRIPLGCHWDASRLQRLKLATPT
jgi:hypothetical protein